MKAVGIAGLSLGAVSAAVQHVVASYAYRKTNQGVFLISRHASVTRTAQSALGGSANASIGGYVVGHLCMKVPCHFDEVALIFANPSGTAYQIAGASVAPGATMNDLTNGSATGRSNFTRVTKGGANSWTLATGTEPLQGYTVTDFIPCASVNRAAGDAATWSVAGGKLYDVYQEPLLHVRVAFPVSAVDQASANSTIVPSTNNSGANTTEWPFNPPQPNASGRFLACTWATGATDQLSVGSATALSGSVYGPFTGIVACPVVGVIFKCRGNVMTVAVCGDSISEGAGLSSPRTGRPWNMVGAELASTMAQPVFHMPLYKSGQTSTTYLGYLNQCIAAGLVPTHIVFPGGTPNESTINTTTRDGFFALRGSQQINPVIWTMLPVGQVAPQKYTNPAQETARIAANESIRGGTVTTGAYEWMEMEKPNLTDNATPYASIPTSLADALVLHPNNSGDLLMRAVWSNKLTQLKSAYYA